MSGNTFEFNWRRLCMIGNVHVCWTCLNRVGNCRTHWLLMQIGHKPWNRRFPSYELLSKGFALPPLELIKWEIIAVKIPLRNNRFYENLCPHSGKVTVIDWSNTWKRYLSSICQAWHLLWPVKKRKTKLEYAHRTCVSKVIYLDMSFQTIIRFEQAVALLNSW